MSPSLGKPVSALSLSELQLSALPPQGAPQHVSLMLQLSALSPQGAPQHVSFMLQLSALPRKGLCSSLLSFP